MNTSPRAQAPPDAARLGRAGAAISVAGALVNLMAYLVPLLGARTLEADSLGAIATVMAILAISSVPGMSLQLAVAVARARHGGVDRLNRWIALAAAAAVLPLLALTPLLATALRLPWPVIPLVAVITTAVIAGNGWLGVMQGGMHFTRLAVAMVLVGLARTGGIIVGLVLRLDLVAILAIGAGSAVALSALVRLLLPAEAQTGPAPGMPRAIWRAGSATLALFVVSYADLIAARYFLSGTASAEYAVLNVLTKGAIWAPQVISILALPYLARRVRNTRRVAVAAVAGVGVVLVLASLLFGPLALRLAGGAAYEHLAPYAAAFAAAGALYALVFLLTNANVAEEAAAPAAPLWLAAGGFTAAVFLLPRPTVGSIVACATIAAAVCAGILLWRPYILTRTRR